MARTPAIEAVIALLPTVNAAHLAGAHTVCVPIEPLQKLITVMLALHALEAPNIHPAARGPDTEATHETRERVRDPDTDT
jgi:hypothetical protein